MVPSDSDVRSCESVRMNLMRHVVVFDAADLAAESSFWAGMLDGQVLADDAFHCVFDADEQWVIGVQLAPGHVAPDWPDGNPQQVHIDLHIDDPASAHAKATAVGARRTATTAAVPAGKTWRVYADPAGHPFCLGWGHPDADTVRRILRGNV